MQARHVPLAALPTPARTASGADHRERRRFPEWAPADPDHRPRPQRHARPGPVRCAL